MAMAWLRKLLGGSDDAPTTQLASAAVREESAHAEKEDSPVSNGRDSAQLYEEYRAELDRAFCLELFGTDRLYVNSTDEQRASARQLARKLAQAEVRTEQLPRKPSTLPSLMKLLKQDELSYAQIAESLLKDPSLTSQVLRTVNSPFFRLNNKTVESLDQAIFIMGVGGIKKVVSAAILLPVFKGAQKTSAFSETVWQWALSAGKSVDELFQARGESEGSAYLLGLLPALAMLLICQEIDAVEGGRPEEHTLLPIQKLDIFKSVGWKYCIAIRKEWGMPEEFDDYLYGLKQSEHEVHSDALATALLVAQYALVQERNGVPISVSQLSLITSSSFEENTRIMAQLQGRIERN
jgi:HD-like signal output (HDOD) protein